MGQPQTDPQIIDRSRQHHIQLRWIADDHQQLTPDIHHVSEHECGQRVAEQLQPTHPFARGCIRGHCNHQYKYIHMRIC